MAPCICAAYSVWVTDETACTSSPQGTLFESRSLVQFSSYHIKKIEYVQTDSKTVLTDGQKFIDIPSPTQASMDELKINLCPGASIITILHLAHTVSYPTSDHPLPNHRPPHRVALWRNTTEVKNSDRWLDVGLHAILVRGVYYIEVSLSSILWDSLWYTLSIIHFLTMTHFQSFRFCSALQILQVIWRKKTNPIPPSLVYTIKFVVY